MQTDEIRLSQSVTQALGLEPINIESTPPPTQNITPEAATIGSEPPQAAPATPTPSPTTVQDEPKGFDYKAIFGDEYDNEEKVKGVIKEYAELKGKLSEYEGKVSDTQYDNDYIKSLREALKQGRTQESHDKVYYSNPESLTEAQKISLQLQWENGIDAATADKLVHYKYKLGDEHDTDDPEVDMARVLMQVDAKKAEKFINENRQRESAPIVDNSLAEQIQAWTPSVPKIASSVSEIEIPNSTWKHKASAETIKAVEKHLMDIISSEYIVVDYNDPKAKEELHQIAQREIWWQERENILRAARTEWEKEKIKEKSVVPPPTGTQSPSPSAEESNMKILAKALRGGV